MNFHLGSSQDATIPLPDTPLGFDRHRTAYNETFYSCRSCGEVGDSLRDIDHNMMCSHGPQRFSDTVGIGTSSDEGITAPIDDKTIRVINDILVKIHDHRSAGPDGCDISQAKEDIGQHAGVNWTASGSTARFTISLGQTNPHGHFHLPDTRPLVLKIDPNIRYDTAQTPVNGNFDELRVWEIASELGQREFFADIVAAPADGAWILMEQCLPVDVRVDDHHHAHRDYVYDRNDEYTLPLRTALEQAGWQSLDWRNGNIGLTQKGTPVLLDYGTTVTHEDYEIEQPNDINM